MNENYFAVVDRNGRFTGIYTYETTKEKAEESCVKAQQKNTEDLVLFAEYAEKYGNDNKYWLDRLEEAKKKEYVVMTMGEFERIQREKTLALPVREVTEEDWDYALGVLPPEKWCRISGVEMFCMSEFDYGVYTSQYARVGGKYYTATVDYFDQSTWIHNRLPQ